MAGLARLIPALLPALLIGGAAFAADPFPTHYITIVVPNAPGGASDFAAAGRRCARATSVDYNVKEQVIRSRIERRSQRAVSRETVD